MNGLQILQHFAVRLSQLDASLPCPHHVLHLSAAPSTIQDLDLLRRSYEGSPAVFPASWAPPWEQVLEGSCLSSGLLKLLGNIVEVEVFRLKYMIDGTEASQMNIENCESSLRVSNACQQKCGVSGECLVCESKGLLELDGDLMACKHLDQESILKVLPIPNSSTEMLEFRAFVSKSSSLMLDHNNELMYLTWRSLPELDATFQNHCTMPKELRFFIENLVYPFTTPDFIVRETIKQRNLWMGTLITSRIHFDALDNIHVCLSGKKVFHLYSPSELPNLYPEPWREDAMNNFSSIGSIFLANSARHPSYFHNVKRFRTEVKGGEAIFIPAGWWHEVFTLQETISVNVWFGPSTNALFRPTLLHLKSERYLQFMLEHQKSNNMM